MFSLIIWNIFFVIYCESLSAYLLHVLMICDKRATGYSVTWRLHCISEFVKKEWTFICSETLLQPLKSKLIHLLYILPPSVVTLVNPLVPELFFFNFSTSCI